MKEKIKCWVSYSDEYPEGIVFDSRVDAMEDSSEFRQSGVDAYVRVKYFTQEELDNFEKT